MLRVCLDVTDAAGPALRGWGRYARELWQALPGAGVEVIAAGAPAGRPEVLHEQLGLPRLARRAGADLIHAPSCFLALRRPCPGVVTVHDLAFEVFPEDFAPRTRLKFHLFAPRSARSAERVICVSAFTRDDLCARYDVDPERVRVVSPGPALALGSGPTPAGPYVLGVGDLRAKKNFGLAVEAVRRLRADGAPHRLVLAGVDAGQGAALAGPGVELRGYVSDAELDALMRGAAALVHPSRYEGFGMVIVEAMARGVPVLAADATALPETVGDAGLLFDPDDPAELAAKLGGVLEHPGELPARGRARAALFSWERAARETAAVYAEAIG